MAERIDIGNGAVMWRTTKEERIKRIEEDAKKYALHFTPGQLKTLNRAQRRRG